MITFRYHVVSLVAVLLALAVGIALGGGPLPRSARGRRRQPTAARASRTAALSDRLDAAAVAFAGPAGHGAGARAVRGLLDGRAVAIVVLPGRRRATVVDGARTAGAAPPAARSPGSTPSRRRCSLDPTSKSLVDTARQPARRGRTRTSTMPDDATTYDRIGPLLGRAIGDHRGRPATRSTPRPPTS